jgi:hypothetical protein
MASKLERCVRGVPEQQEVYAADLKAAHLRAHQAKAESVELEKSPEEFAVDGVAHHVHNTLRGAEDVCEHGTFEAIRAIIARGLAQ